MNQLTIAGKTYHGTSKAMDSAISHFKRVLARHNGIMALGIEEESGPVAVYHQFLALRQRDGRSKAQAVREFVTQFPREHEDFLREYNQRFGRSV